MMYLLGSAIIKEKVSAPLVSQPPNMVPKHVLMSHRAHCFIIDVQPNFPCVAVSVRVKDVDIIVPTACRFSVMVEHSIELVMRWL